MGARWPDALDVPLEAIGEDLDGGQKAGQTGYVRVHFINQLVCVNAVRMASVQRRKLCGKQLSEIVLRRYWAVTGYKARPVSGGALLANVAPKHFRILFYLLKNVTYAAGIGHMNGRFEGPLELLCFLEQDRVMQARSFLKGSPLSAC